MTVINLTQEREQRLAEHRQRLLAAAVGVSFPAQQVIDQHDGRVYLDELGARHLEELFALFGVDELDVQVPDNFQTVMHTWFVLCGEVGSHVRSRSLFGQALNDRLAGAWKPEYRAYVDALWDGDTARIAKQAKVLGITRGIPKGAPDITGE